MKINNEQIYEGIKKSLTEDLILAYEVFKAEEHPNLEGVILSIDSSGSFANYLREHPEKFADFMDHLYTSLDFVVHLVFNKEFEDGFFPLVEK